MNPIIWNDRWINSFILLPFLLLFIGDIQAPVAGSSITIPIGMIIIIPMGIYRLFTHPTKLPKIIFLLLGIVVFGLIGTVLTPQALLPRAGAAALPLLFATITIFAYSNTNVSTQKAITLMLIGGTALAIAVLILFFIALSGTTGYYEQKLLIETPLGRSNYLAAFLIFLVALSASRNKWLAGLFALAALCTMSRGGAIMLVLFIFAVPLARNRKLWMLGLASVGVFMIFLLTTIVKPELFLDFTNDNSDYTSTLNRLLIWSYGTDLWLSQPVFGIGPNTFRTFVEMRGDVEDVWGVHNSILLMLLNYGILGTVFYTFYLRAIYKQICRAELNEPLFLYLRAGFFVLLAFSLFEPLVGSAAFETLLALLLVLAKGSAIQVANITSLNRVRKPQM